MMYVYVFRATYIVKQYKYLNRSKHSVLYLRNMVSVPSDGLYQLRISHARKKGVYYTDI
jgi:hypothetical protein